MVQKELVPHDATQSSRPMRERIAGVATLSQAMGHDPEDAFRLAVSENKPRKV